MGFQLGQVRIVETVQILLFFLQQVHCRQEPHTLVRPSKSGSVDSEKVEKVKPTATRNLILIRHGQYNLKGTSDEERYLTSLGKDLFPLCCISLMKCPI